MCSRLRILCGGLCFCLATGVPATNRLLREGKRQSRIGIPACVSLGENTGDWEGGCENQTPMDPDTADNLEELRMEPWDLR